MTMNGTWGYDKRNKSWTPTAQLLRYLCNAASKGGNYLLNVGPDELGEIPEGSLERLSQVGAWLKVNGEAIYGSSGSPFQHASPWGWITSKGTRLYICLDKLPADHKLVLPELTSRISRAWFLTDPAKQSLQITTAENGTPTLIVPDPVPVSIGENPEVIIVELAAKPFATLLEFALPGMPEATIKGTEIRIEVPQSTDLTRLAPVYNTGSPMVTGEPASGSTHDFTKPVTYKIKGADGSTKSYRVTVTPKRGASGIANGNFENFAFVGEYKPENKIDYLIPTWSFHRPNPGEPGISSELGVLDLMEFGGNGGQTQTPAGTHYCAYMRAAGNGVSQALQFDQGTYTVSLDVIKRNGYEPYSPLLVTLDGKTVCTMEADTITEAWSRFTSPGFAVTAGTHSLGFSVGKGGGMIMIDNVGLQFRK